MDEGWGGGREAKTSLLLGPITVQSHRHTMQGATPDNANPIVHSTSSRPRSSRHRGLDLDFDDDELWLRGSPSLSAGWQVGDSMDDSEDGASADDEVEEIGSDEVFGMSHPRVSASDGLTLRGRSIDLIRSISDPEHPLTLEQLAVVSAGQISIKNGTRPSVLVEFTPTIPHCSMATLIGAVSLLWAKERC
jgi:hypothetical protein